MSKPFKFDAANLIALFELLGRRDSAAYNLIADFEAAIKDFLEHGATSFSESPHFELKRKIDWANRLSCELRSALDPIGRQLKRLESERTIPDLTERRIAHAIERIGEALHELEISADALAGRCSQIVQKDRFEEILLEKMAMAYCSRLAIQPSVEPDGAFRKLVEMSLSRAAIIAPMLGRMLTEINEEKLSVVVENTMQRFRAAGPELYRISNH